MTSTVYIDFFFFNDTATTEIYTLSLHDALPISPGGDSRAGERCRLHMRVACRCLREEVRRHARVLAGIAVNTFSRYIPLGSGRDRKSTRLNSSHSQISYAVFCLKKKTSTITYHI